jgi:hypothetical protein
MEFQLLNKSISVTNLWENLDVVQLEVEVVEMVFDFHHNHRVVEADIHHIHRVVVVGSHQIHLVVVVDSHRIHLVVVVDKVHCTYSDLDSFFQSTMTYDESLFNKRSIINKENYEILFFRR